MSARNDGSAFAGLVMLMLIFTICGVFLISAARGNFDTTCAPTPSTPQPRDE
jgi:hypothetical protein